MCIQNKLENLLLFILLMILASCSGSDKDVSSSLNADDIWDQMARERQKPLPVNSQTDDSGEIVIDPPFIVSSDPLSDDDTDAHRTTLRIAAKKYHDSIAALDAGFVVLMQETGTADDRQVALRTMQLYLSRLANLKNNMGRAVNALGDGDKILAENGRNLMMEIAEYLDHTRSRLDDITDLNE